MLENWGSVISGEETLNFSVMVDSTLGDSEQLFFFFQNLTVDLEGK